MQVQQSIRWSSLAALALVLAGGIVLIALGHEGAGLPLTTAGAAGAFAIWGSPGHNRSCRTSGSGTAGR